MKNLKFLIAEDHDLYREGLLNLLKETFVGCTIIESGDFPTAYTLIEEHRDLSLLILDIQLPGTERLDGLKLLRYQFPLLPIVVISALEMGANVQNIMAAGANGFISKAVKKSQMQEGLQAVLMRGEMVAITNCSHTLPPFSPRHIETLDLLAEGLTNKGIANKLGISEITVRQYMSEIFNYLQVDNRTQAVIVAKKYGILID
ncbi:response regulator transcription factor [Zooshikella harenae]|uniref:Response regulator transcription factor n=1 Tax=Zooshikella harenae TaxID=2827238 RepID=A0ABS5ZCE8_9GAMM|nr:response regulator transcription factor [Zooshikella harenae]MBU2710940.1 response regulator transcription factor [Zooshikella harenae]